MYSERSGKGRYQPSRPANTSPNARANRTSGTSCRAIPKWSTHGSSPAAGARPWDSRCSSSRRNARRRPNRARATSLGAWWPRVAVEPAAANGVLDQLASGLVQHGCGQRGQADRAAQGGQPAQQDALVAEQRPGCLRRRRGQPRASRRCRRAAAARGPAARGPAARGSPGPPAWPRCPRGSPARHTPRRPALAASHQAGRARAGSRHPPAQRTRTAISRPAASAGSRGRSARARSLPGNDWRR
jgi:hypothetical protein